MKTTNEARIETLKNAMVLWFSRKAPAPKPEEFENAELQALIDRVSDLTCELSENSHTQLQICDIIEGIAVQVRAIPVPDELRDDMRNMLESWAESVASIRARNTGFRASHVMVLRDEILSSLLSAAEALIGDREVNAITAEELHTYVMACANNLAAGLDHRTVPDADTDEDLARLHRARAAELVKRS